MISFAFKKIDFVFPAFLAILILAMSYWSSLHGRPVGYAPYVIFFIVVVDCFVSAYFRSRSEARELERRLWVKAQPLIQLTDQLAEEVSRKRTELDSVKGEVSSLETTRQAMHQLANLDKQAIEILLLQMAKPRSSDVWRERFFGFTLGVVGSLLASTIYDFLKNVVFA